MKKTIRLTESEFRAMVQETVETVINEAYSDAQYAHLAGQAHGALNSFGGRLKGMFNPKWKNRKKRQMNKFADQATHFVVDPHSSTSGGDYNNGKATYRMPGDNYKYDKGGQIDYISNSFNQKNSKSPFEMTRHHAYVDADDNYRAMDNNGDVYSRDETRNIANQHADNKEWDRYDQMANLRNSNSMLNTAFKQGQQARKGKMHKTFGGETYTNGTGTSSGAFKRLK